MESPQRDKFIQYDKLPETESKEKIIFFPSGKESHKKARKTKYDQRVNYTVMGWKSK